MAPVNGTLGRNMERSERDVRGKSRRKRRRRCSSKGQSSVMPTLISNKKLCNPTTSSAGDAETSGPGCLEVKENHVDAQPLDCDSLLRYHPSKFCLPFPMCPSRSLKRKLPLGEGRDGFINQNHWMCKKAAWSITQKNALVQLNELRPGLQFEIKSKTGPLHAPVFSVGVEVNGFHFEGTGRTKKQARMRAAELALQSFIQFPNAPQVQAIMGNFPRADVDFTADKMDIPETLHKELDPSTQENNFPCNIFNQRRLVRLTLDLISSKNPTRRGLSTSFLDHLGPVALLNQLRPGLRYICVTERVYGKPLRSFVMVLRVEGKVFEGCGHSKRQAKAKAAAAALQDIFNIGLGVERRIMGLQGGRTRNQLPQFFAESIFQLVREKYSELADSCPSSSLARNKSLAGIVMTRGFDLRSAQVVSLATGTKCLDSDVGREHSCELRDCHAEAVCRRALVRFLCAQLELLLCKPAACGEQSIFVPNKVSSDGGHSSFRLQDGLLFHMYVSSSPCGDARLNCPYEATAAFRSRRFHCHLRVKVEGGEGTLPISARRTNQKREGFSKPYVTMSCTDKIAKWSVLGLQGALLSHMVEPVYLHSLTVGTLGHTGHLSRVMSRRLASVKHLPFPYRRQQLLLGCLGSSEIRPVGKAPNISVNWSCGDGGVEEISTSTGLKRDTGTPSRLCRRSVFAQWQRLQQQVHGHTVSAEATSGSYHGSKMAAGHYQRTMQQFTSALQSGGLGAWPRKPPELYNFNISA